MGILAEILGSSLSGKIGNKLAGFIFYCFVEGAFRTYLAVLSIF